MKLLLEKSAQTNSCTNSRVSPLYVACQEGHFDIVKLLVKHKADINLCKNDGSSPLSIANKKKHLNIVEFLQENGANSICEVSQNGHDNTAQLGRNNCSGFDFIRDIENKPLLLVTKDEDT